MVIENTSGQQTRVAEKPPITVQNDVNKEVQKEVQKEATVSGGTQASQKQILALISGDQPKQQIEQIAKEQISRGYLDVTV